MILVNSLLDLVSVVLYQSLNWPGSCVSQRTNCVTFYLLCYLPQHVNLSVICLSDLHSLQHISQPWCSLSAWCALTAALMLVELWQSQDCLDHVCLFVHNNNCCCTQTTFKLSQSIEVHQNILAKFFRQKSDWWSTWNDGFKIVPSTNYTTTVSVNKFPQRNGHFFFNCAWIIDVSRNTE